jgi:hypothetical protein
LLTKHSDDSFTVLLIYVDDIILVGNTMPEITRIKSILDNQFGTKDLGILKFVSVGTALISLQILVFLALNLPPLL